MYPQNLGAVQVLHSQNLQHNDLKCGNILVLWTSGRPVVKLADLGFTRSLEEQRRKFARLGIRAQRFCRETKPNGGHMRRISGPWESFCWSLLPDRGRGRRQTIAIPPTRNSCKTRELPQTSQQAPQHRGIGGKLRIAGRGFPKDKVTKENSVLKAYDDSENLALDAILAHGASESSLRPSFLQENPDVDVAADPILLLPEQTVVKAGKGWKIIRKQKMENRSAKVEDDGALKDALVVGDKGKGWKVIGKPGADTVAKAVDDIVVGESCAQNVKAGEKQALKSFIDMSDWITWIEAENLGIIEEDFLTLNPQRAPGVGHDVVRRHDFDALVKVYYQPFNPVTIENRRNHIEEQKIHMRNLAATLAMSKMEGEWALQGGWNSFEKWFDADQGEGAAGDGAVGEDVAGKGVVGEGVVDEGVADEGVAGESVVDG
ncbi:hypothetical protein BC938DRAFT_472224 [Jimgerdemannia flammicorona]|uniref:Protein kinase domain-containing protein n=1 Tax=Jimgerdemannia flammicorona TaxID=994334 RepID=A0A433Q6K2_9FUNG|nr:hypothetical protein BC938DRAFT_472224 [Jimgerdemannia flammicorona]